MKQMKPMKLLKPMKSSPRRSSGDGNGLFWFIVVLVVLYILLMGSGCFGENLMMELLQGEEPPY